MDRYDLKLKGYVGGWDFNLDDVDEVLKKKSDSPVNVLIDSLGGSLSTALSISSSFAEHGNVHVHFVGMNASAATIASMGAKEITIDRSAMYLVHKCSNIVFKFGQLNADSMQTLIEELQKMKNDLDKLDYNVAGLYARRCKKEPEALMQLMTTGGWLTAEDAKEWGFVDEITDYMEETAPVMTQALASEMLGAGIPLPNVPFKAESNGLESLIEMARNFIGYFMSTRKTESNTKTPVTMNIECNNVTTAMGVDALESNNGTVTLTEAQVLALESAMQEMQNQLTTANESIASLESQVAALKASPADDTTDVVADGSSHETTAADTFYDTVASARKLFDLV